MVGMDQMGELTGQAWSTWQGWGVTGWFVLGLVVVLALRRYLMRAVARRARRMIMVAAVTAYLGGGAATLSIGDYIGAAAPEHCAAVDSADTSVKNLPANVICGVRGGLEKAGGLLSRDSGGPSQSSSSTSRFSGSAASSAAL